MSLPNPGSKEALEQGCECAVMDNHYGKGFKLMGKQSFWINQECPLHGESTLTKEENKNG